MPQCTLRVARFRGTDRTEFLDNRQFHGNAFTLLKAAERFLRETLPIAGRIEADRFERVDEPLYPTVAIREALANALCHRDYSIGGGSVGVAVYDDRLEITSSGSLHFGLTPETRVNKRTGLFRLIPAYSGLLRRIELTVREHALRRAWYLGRSLSSSTRPHTSWKILRTCG